MSEPMTDKERAREAIIRPKGGHINWAIRDWQVAQVAAALAEVRQETVEACAKVAEKYGNARTEGVVSSWDAQWIGEWHQSIAGEIRSLANTGQGGSGR